MVLTKCAKPTTGGLSIALTVMAVLSYLYSLRLFLASSAMGGDDDKSKMVVQDVQLEEVKQEEKKEPPPPPPPPNHQNLQKWKWPNSLLPKL